MGLSSNLGLDRAGTFWSIGSLAAVTAPSKAGGWETAALFIVCKNFTPREWCERSQIDFHEMLHLRLILRAALHFLILFCKRLVLGIAGEELIFGLIGF